MLLQLSIPSYAGTVGTISGTVTQTDTHAPLAGVAVTATAPTGTFHATTNARGFFALIGLEPDTYTVSFSLQEHEPVTLTGVSVFADQTANASTTMQTSLKQIAEVRSHSVASAFQPHQTADTYSVTATQIQNVLGSSSNISQTSLLTALPGAQLSAGGYPSIRGGRTNNVDYEFEGMNYTDPYTQKNISGFNLPAFGLQSVQLSPGNEDESFGNSGVGTVNTTARRGAYPGVTDVAIAAGGPGFFHSLAGGYGIASPNGRISEYLSFTGQDNAPRYGGSYWTQNANDIGVQDRTMYTTDREILSNTVLRFGHTNQFSAQLLFNLGSRQTFGGYGNALEKNICFLSCNTNGDVGFFTCCSMPSGATQLSLDQIQQLMLFMPGQTGQNQAINGPEYQEEGLSNGTKFQLTWNPNGSTYIYAGWDTTNGITTSNHPENGIFRVAGGYNAEFNGGLTKQLGDKNSLRANIHATRNRPISEGYFPDDEIWNTSPGCCGGVGEIFDFISPSDPNCQAIAWVDRRAERMRLPVQ